MARRTFVGGIHPYDGKDLSKDKPIKEILPKKELVYPMVQHIGAPAIPVVNIGDKVLAGQKIAEADGLVSSPIYATVSGTVIKIEEHRVVTGDKIKSIIIENDGLYQEVKYSTPKPIEELSRMDIIHLIKEAGIVGMGGAGFPTHVKLSPKNPENIKYVIANCAECEPYLTSDYRRMLEEPERIIGGLKVLLSLFENASGIIAIEDNKPDCIDLFKKMIKGEPRIMVKPVKTKYPQGAEKQLIYATTGQAIHSKQLPSDVGCIVNNADTITAIYQAVIEGKPLLHKIVTITGEAIVNPRNFKVKLGTNYGDLIEEAGGFFEEPSKIISGGPMMGFSIFDVNVPTTKTASALICFLTDEVAKHVPTACINCGKCVDACPSRLIPSKLSVFADHFDEERFLSYNGMECCECGCCSFVCPAKRQLAQSIKSMRKIQLSKNKK